MREMCGRISCPALVIRAEHGEPFARDDFDRVVGSFPSAHGVVLPDSGHMVMWEIPGRVADLTLRFLASPE